MCVECGFSKCPSGCPNAPEPRERFKCKSCGESIRVGDEAYEFEGEHYHEECFSDNAVEILKDMGAKLEIVSENDDDGSDDVYENYRH